ncbi:asparagine synthetase domain-containing protein 1 [Nasonia vitripennis]|uniref:Glutamine amidotransferase type-2 domain-containing protein n=1 Tax=Nasonia vitripennis TaxID=7425 RepID=A0A7M7G949_NASVI|nr:asparagine synthetase domain-containing protein 1 [Nasonia vitripennis]
MCGIFCMINSSANARRESSNPKEPFEWTLCKDMIAARGPDCLNSLEEGLTELWHGHFHASVLWMQGAEPVSQPLVDTDCNILLWNGDVLAGNMHKRGICDSTVVLSALKNSNDIAATVREIKGPFSFCYYQKSSNMLYFARDKFGRHSLLFKINERHDSLVITSVAVKSMPNIEELPAIGIFIADLNYEKVQLKCIPWVEPNERVIKILNDLENRLNIVVNILRSENFPEIENLSLGLIPDSEMGFLKYFKYTNVCSTYDEIMDYLLRQESINETVDRLLIFLEESVRRRVQLIPEFCRNCTGVALMSVEPCKHAKVGLLFSGGLDSAILAVMAHRNINPNETIDLINVAFEKKNNSNYEVPDRITGRKTFNELLKICPNRNFNFIEVNVSEQELKIYRSTQIANLVYPRATVLDDSLACAVWFASRGRGTVYPKKEFYTSSCRVLLLGMGADEQFGGYMRHRTILKHKGWAILTEELQLEFDRISERNLGRDDRMVADHGRQSRLPYLDEDLVQFVQQLAPWERCCPVEKFPPGLGDKLLLRLLARKIKLHEAAKFPKRAFQFGSRIADGKENAKDVSKRL